MNVLNPVEMCRKGLTPLWAQKAGGGTAGHCALKGLPSTPICTSPCPFPGVQVWHTEKAGASGLTARFNRDKPRVGHRRCWEVNSTRLSRTMLNAYSHSQRVLPQIMPLSLLFLLGRLNFYNHGRTSCPRRDRRIICRLISALRCELENGSWRGIFPSSIAQLHHIHMCYAFHFCAHGSLLSVKFVHGVTETLAGLRNISENMSESDTVAGTRQFTGYLSAQRSNKCWSFVDMNSGNRQETGTRSSGAVPRATHRPVPPFSEALVLILLPTMERLWKKFGKYTFEMPKLLG